MSVAAFPPTSSRSTKPRTSTHAPEFAGVQAGSRFLTGWRVATHAAVSQRIGPVPDDSGGAVRIAPLARRGGLSVQGPTVRLLSRPFPFPSATAALTSRRSLGSSVAWYLWPRGLLGSRESRIWRKFGPMRKFRCPPEDPPPGPASRLPGPPRAPACLPARDTPEVAQMSRSLAAYLAPYREHGPHLPGLMRMNVPCRGNVLSCEAHTRIKRDRGHAATMRSRQGRARPMRTHPAPVL